MQRADELSAEDQKSGVDTGAVVRAATLTGFGMMVWITFLDGSLNYYVHPRYNGLIAVTGAAMLLGGGIGLVLALGKQETVEPRQKTHWLTYTLLLVPLICGLLVPAHPLGVNAIQNSGTRSITGSTTLRSAAAIRPGGGQMEHTTDTRQWTLLEWSYAINEDSTLISYVGKGVDLVGFVYRPKSGVVKGGGQFYVARYIVICCTADSTGTSLPVAVVKTGIPTPANDRWVRVRGRIAQPPDATGAPVAVVAADSIESVAPPRDPYLYP